MYVETDRGVSAGEVAAVIAAVRHLDLSPGPGGSRMSEPAATAAALRPVLAAVFPEPWPYATVIALSPSSQLVAHRDRGVDGKQHERTRYHLPIQVNPSCWSFHAGTWQQLIVGRCYQMDPTETHGAVNWGETVRMHVIVDLAKER